MGSKSNEKAESKTSDSKLKSLKKCFSDRTPDRDPPMYKLLKLKSWPMLFGRLPLNESELTPNCVKDERFPRLEGKEPLNRFSDRLRCCRCSCFRNQSGIGPLSSLSSNLKDLSFRRLQALGYLAPQTIGAKINMRDVTTNIKQPIRQIGVEIVLRQVKSH